MIAIPAWIEENQRQQRPTEILLPVVMGIGPTWDYGTESGGWYARLDVDPCMTDQPIWDCDHTHPTESEAWACAEGAARAVAELRVRSIR